MGLTIYEFCLAHVYFFQRCYKKIFGQSPSKNAIVAPFVPIDIISTGTTGINKIRQLSQSQTKSYVIEADEIILEVKN